VYTVRNEDRCFAMEKTMDGWIVPPPREPVMSREELDRERRRKVEWLERHGYGSGSGRERP
jgi:hypothetical protein